MKSLLFPTGTPATRPCQARRFGVNVAIPIRYLPAPAQSRRMTPRDSLPRLGPVRSGPVRSHNQEYRS